MGACPADVSFPSGAAARPRARVLRARVRLPALAACCAADEAAVLLMAASMSMGLRPPLPFVARPLLRTAALERFAGGGVCAPAPGLRSPWLAAAVVLVLVIAVLLLPRLDCARLPDALVARGAAARSPPSSSPLSSPLSTVPSESASSPMHTCGGSWPEVSELKYKVEQEASDCGQPREIDSRTLTRHLHSTPFTQSLTVGTAASCAAHCRRPKRGKEAANKRVGGSCAELCARGKLCVPLLQDVLGQRHQRQQGLKGGRDCSSEWGMNRGRERRVTKGGLARGTGLGSTPTSFVTLRRHVLPASYKG